MNKQSIFLAMVALLLTRVSLAQDAVAPAQTAQPTAQPAAAIKPQSRPGIMRDGTRADRLDLETTVVTGNRELPKVLYIVPWKKAELGELPAQPFNTLLDEVLQPVDRDVFKREVKYFQAVASGTAAGSETAKPAAAPVPAGQQ